MSRTKTTTHLFILEPGLPFLTSIHVTCQMGDIRIVGHYQMQSSPIGQVQLPDVQTEYYLGLQLLSSGHLARPRVKGLPAQLVGAMTTNINQWSGSPFLKGCFGHFLHWWCSMGFPHLQSKYGILGMPWALRWICLPMFGKHLKVQID